MGLVFFLLGSSFLLLTYIDGDILYTDACFLLLNVNETSAAWPITRGSTAARLSTGVA
jgi:hypothetical protein